MRIEEQRFTPLRLSEPNMPYIEEFMVDAINPHEKSVLLHLPDDQEDVDSSVMELRRECDASFARQMKDLQDAQPPDLYVVTAKSAIPVADSIRGFYAELGMPEPAIAQVRANQVTAAMYHGIRDTDLVDSFLDTIGTPLKPYISEAQTACIVDQYVFSGRTFMFAAKVLQGLGM